MNNGNFYPWHLSLYMREPTICVSEQVDTTPPVQSQKQARTLKFPVQEEEELYYLCSENKGPDQLCSYCEADCLIFHP